MNTSLLEDPHTLTQIQDYWKIWQGKKDDYNDPLQWWDEGKLYIKKKIIHISSQNKKARKQMQINLQNQLEILERQYNNPSQSH